MSGRKDPSNSYQMVSPSISTTSGMNGLDCLRRVDSLFVKQYVSLTEGKLVWKKVKFIFMIIEVICGFASEAKFDIFNDRNERILQAFESK